MIKVLCVCSGGGHLTEMLYALPKAYESDAVFITTDGGHTRDTLSSKNTYFFKDPHRSIWGFWVLTLKATVLMLKLKPKVIISTGAGFAVPFVFLGRLVGSTIIFIETGARIKKPSLTGRLVYVISHHFFIQSKELKRKYKNAQYSTLW